MSNDKIIEQYCKLSLNRRNSSNSLLLNNINDDRPTDPDYNNNNLEKDITVDNYNNDLFSENSNHKRIDENNVFSLNIESIFSFENKDEQIDESDDNKTYFHNKQTKKNSKIKKILGRKTKKNKGNQNGNHTKENDDNIINKIKSHFFKYVNDTINKALTKECNYKFIQIPYKMVKNSKRDYNLDLLKSPLKKLYQQTNDYKGKFKRKDYSDNETILKYLEKNKEKEKKANDLLNKNVSLILDDFRKTNMEQFLDEIRSKYKEENQEEVEKYLEKVKKLCKGLENYFKNKPTRITKKNKI